MHRPRVPAEAAKAEWGREHPDRVGPRRRRRSGRSATTHRSSGPCRLDDHRPEAGAPAPNCSPDWSGVKPEDTHLRHAVRIALRETLRDPAAMTALVPAGSTNAELRRRRRAARPAEQGRGRLPGRAPDEPDRRWRRSARRVRRPREPVRRGAQGHLRLHHHPQAGRRAADRSACSPPTSAASSRRAGSRFDQDDTTFAEGLCEGPGATTTAQVIQACLDVATGMKLKASAGPIRDFAMKKDRPDPQRGAAFAALPNLDPVQGGPLLGKVLADPDERIEVRERVAQALAASARRPRTRSWPPRWRKPRPGCRRHRPGDGRPAGGGRSPARGGGGRQGVAAAAPGAGRPDEAQRQQAAQGSASGSPS